MTSESEIRSGVRLPSPTDVDNGRTNEADTHLPEIILPSVTRASEQRKWCRGCGEVKPVTEFGRHGRAFDGLQGRCRSCERTRMQKRRHGVTAADKAEAARSQGGCLICRRSEPGAKGWVVDHDRSCCPGDKSCPGCRRGVLCQWCNSMLGYALDNPETLRAAAKYLEAGTRMEAQR